MTTLLKTTASPVTHRWFAADFDGHPARVIALSLFTVQAVLFVIGWLVDRAFDSATVGFWGSMLLYAALVYIDARAIRFPVSRALLWSAVAMFGLILGAYAYALQRQYRARVNKAGGLP